MMTSLDPRAQTDDRDWRLDAACRGHADPDLWFAKDSEPGTTTALAICGNCPVAYECGETAFNAAEEFGTWGGKTPRQRTYERRAAAKVRRALSILAEAAA